MCMFSLDRSVPDRGCVATSAPRSAMGLAAFHDGCADVLLATRLPIGRRLIPIAGRGAGARWRQRDPRDDPADTDIAQPLGSLARTHSSPPRPPQAGWAAPLRPFDEPAGCTPEDEWGG